MTFTKEDYDRYIQDLADTASQVQKGTVKYSDEVKSFDALASSKTVDLVAGGHTFKIYIRTPEKQEKNSALYINIHGGGWYVKHEENDSYFAAWMADRIKGVVIDVDYSTSDIVPWGVMIEQCIKAADYAIEHCEELGCDPKRISIGGYSAGGHLAAGVVIRMLQENRNPFALEVFAYTPFDMSKKKEKEPENENEAHLQKRGRAFNGLLMRNDESLRSDPAFNITAASDVLLVQLPKTLYITAQNCPFRDEDEQFAMRTISLGVETTIRRFATSHGFIPHFMKCWEEGADLIARYVTGSRRSEE